MREESDHKFDWENSRIFNINKEPAHATLIPFGSKKLISKNSKDSTYSKSLNGIWKFNWVKMPSERPKDFYKVDLMKHKIYVFCRQKMFTGNTGPKPRRFWTECFIWQNCQGRI